MMQFQKQVLKINKIIDSSNQFYQNLLGYKPEQISLQSVTNSKWNNFAQTRGLNSNSLGIYLPRNQTAIIQEQNSLSLFHEYFGHGLYSEQSLQGRKLVDLEKKLLKEEKQKFQNSRFTLENVQKFRQQNQTYQELNEFKKQNLAQYETFAIWTEYLLSKKFGMRDKFEKKYDSLCNQNKKVIDSIINFNKRNGNLATFYESGLARRTNPLRAKKLLKNIYSKNEFQNITFALLYGSKKEFSDIDVFIVGENIPEVQTNWLDIRVETTKDFERGIKFLDCSFICPLFESEYIIGNKENLMNIKNKFKESKITDQAIKYNFEQGEEQRNFAMEYPENSLERIHGLKYSQTYFRNSLALKENQRLFTKEDLFSEPKNENFIGLKGGSRII
jgi:predicted nucleotidyltransferase